MQLFRLRRNRPWSLSFRFITGLVALTCLGWLFVALASPAPPDETVAPAAAPAAEQGAPVPGGTAEPLGPESGPQTGALSPSAIRVVTRSWIPKGPAPIENGQAAASPNNQVSGAIKAVAAHPTKADIIYVGTVNGGMW